MSEQMSHLVLEPGTEISVRVDCSRCESYRWRAINPLRNMQRALRRLTTLDVQNLRDDEQEAVQEAIWFLSEGEHDARHLAQHANEDERPQRQDSLQDQMHDVWQAAEAMGCLDAADWIKDRVGEFR